MVSGAGTAFKTNVSVGDVMIIPGIPLGFKIAEVIDDVTLQLNAPAPGTGSLTVSGLVFLIASNFTPVMNLPLPGSHMLDVQGFINRAWKILDLEMPTSVKGLISP